MLRLILPAALALLLGFMYGRRMTFTGNTIVAIVAGFIFSLLLAAYPYYTVFYSGLPSSFSEIFFMALIGALLGSIRRGGHEGVTSAR